MNTKKSLLIWLRHSCNDLSQNRRAKLKKANVQHETQQPKPSHKSEFNQQVIRQSTNPRSNHKRTSSKQVQFKGKIEKISLRRFSLENAKWCQEKWREVLTELGRTIQNSKHNRVYRVEYLIGRIISDTWNASHLKYYFSWMMWWILFPDFVFFSLRSIFAKKVLMRLQ